MAQAGAHFITAAVDDRPSIFEVLAQESLMEAVKPALRHAAKVLAESNPSVLGFLWQRFDEIFMVLDLLLQNHFLSLSSASFSENFYGLKRVSSSRRVLPVHLGLNRKSHWLSLLLLCLVPYLRAKLELTLARQRDEDDFSIRVVRSRSQSLYRALLAAYPYASTAWAGWLLCQQLLYVFGQVQAHSPLLWLAGVRLAHLTALDIRDMELQGHITENPTGLSLLQRAWCAVGQVAGGVAVSLSTSLSLGVFFLQFLEWWYSSENQSTVKTLTSLPTPPPPLHLRQEASSSWPTGRLSGEAGFTSCGGSWECPLCLNRRTNNTVLSTSGFVFCYPCVYRYVKNNQRCPVTGYPTELQHLVKIYVPES
ncbi:peroxisome assembly protein 12 [Lampris incognitus]|uniref:peroxisome assembly protein 12 n=1 Tax=Lampris incognitus TaxID=2546036 RepID=UPI0024B6207E|nr:peroxisome assembly protein 12 [Lampris incognitus]